MRVLRFAALGSQRLLDLTGVPSLIERRTLLHAPDTGPEPIFILGPPRSGTTLLYELLVGHFRTGYLSNVAALFASAPVSATRIASKWLPRHEPHYRSELGFVPGLMAPSEAGAVVRRWFAGDAPLSARDGGVSVRRGFFEIARLMGGPVVMKNLNLDHLLGRVLHVFPGALLVRMRRAPPFTAQSILKARKAQSGDAARWWSIKPPGYERLLAMDAYTQIAWQLRLLDEAVERAVGAHATQLFDCQYEQLCNDPASMLRSIGAAYAAHCGQSPEVISTPPRSFAISEHIDLDTDEWNLLNAALQRVAAADRFDDGATTG
jgi:LPS sulfotransferase NodH